MAQSLDRGHDNLNSTQVSKCSIIKENHNILNTLKDFFLFRTNLDSVAVKVRTDSLVPRRVLPSQMVGIALSQPPTFHRLSSPYQLLEYQTDMRRCRFDTLGKQTSAHLAGGPTPYTGWVPPARWVSAGAASPSPPTARAGWQPARAVGGPAAVAI